MEIRANLNNSLFTHTGEKGIKSKHGKNQLELSKGHCNGFLCSLKHIVTAPSICSSVHIGQFFFDSHCCALAVRGGSPVLLDVRCHV